MSLNFYSCNHLEEATGGSTFRWGNGAIFFAPQAVVLNQTTCIKSFKGACAHLRVSYIYHRMQIACQNLRVTLLYFAEAKTRHQQLPFRLLQLLQSKSPDKTQIVKIKSIVCVNVCVCRTHLKYV